MNLKTIAFLLLTMVGVGQGAVTLRFSTTSIYVGGFQNGSGNINGSTARLVWGVIADGDGDGFDNITTTLNYAAGFSLAASAAGSNLGLVGGTETDDRLYVSPSVMLSNTASIDGAAIGDNRISVFSAIQYGGTAGPGDTFRIVWFDVTSLGGAASEGLKFGMLADASFVLPPDGTIAGYSDNFIGADVSKPMNFMVGVPEPSVSFLCVIGSLVITRRRRRRSASLLPNQ